MRWIVMTFAVMLAGCIPSGLETATPDADDPCGAANYAHLIGSPASDLPDFPEASIVRVYDPATDAVTRDYRIDRLNVEIDRSADQVLRVACG